MQEDWQLATPAKDCQDSKFAPVQYLFHLGRFVGSRFFEGLVHLQRYPDLRVET